MAEMTAYASLFWLDIATCGPGPGSGVLEEHCCEDAPLLGGRLVKEFSEDISRVSEARAICALLGGVLC